MENSNFVENESQSSSFSLKRIFLNITAGILGSTVTHIVAFSSLQWVHPFLVSPYYSSCSDPWIVICDLETCLAWVRAEAEFQHSLFTSPYEILLGEILWLSLDLPY